MPIRGRGCCTSITFFRAVKQDVGETLCRGEAWSANYISSQSDWPLMTIDTGPQSEKPSLARFLHRLSAIGIVTRRAKTNLDVL